LGKGGNVIKEMSVGAMVEHKKNPPGRGIGKERQRWQGMTVSQLGKTSSKKRRGKTNSRGGAWGGNTTGRGVYQGKGLITPPQARS